jgi:predicted patatin/cPLA2 family phospholipase
MVDKITKSLLKKSFDIATIPTDYLKEKVEQTIRERALKALKVELTMRKKTFDDYNDEELEILIAEEEHKIIDNLKTKTLLAALALLGINLI